MLCKQISFGCFESVCVSSVYYCNICYERVLLSDVLSFSHVHTILSYKQIVMLNENIDTQWLKE